MEFSPLHTVSGETSKITFPRGKAVLVTGEAVLVTSEVVLVIQ
jgi:hypothetical protein